MATIPPPAPPIVARAAEMAGIWGPARFTGGEAVAGTSKIRSNRRCQRAQLVGSAGQDVEETAERAAAIEGVTQPLGQVGLGCRGGWR